MDARFVRTGNEAVLNEIIEYHGEALFRLAYLLLGNSADAQDVAQEALLRAYSRLHYFDQSRPLRPWLLRMVANLARNKRRSIRRYWGMLSRFAHHTPITYPNPETELVNQSDSLQLWQAIRKLPDSEQEIIYLRFFLNMTIEETAQTLNIAQGTVKSRLHRALKHLKGIILREFPTLSEGIS